VVVVAMKTSHVGAVRPVSVPFMCPCDFDGVSVPSVVMSVEDVLSVFYKFFGV